MELFDIFSLRLEKKKPAERQGRCFQVSDRLPCSRVILGDRQEAMDLNYKKVGFDWIS